MQDTVTEAIRKEIRILMNEWADYMAGGSCTGYEEYKHMAGKIEGLAVVERIILDLEDRMDRWR